ncbi:MAG: RNA polymerase sigma factor [Planctomycetaceae bacterium]|nr:RNA polymerase sigma factor [Planctomycetaceae bacterium]
MNSDSSHFHHRLTDGDDDAWTEFFDQHAARIWRYAARFTGADDATVADIVQEVFSAACRSIQSFDRSRGTTICWLLGITHRQAARLRRQQLRIPVAVTSLEAFNEPATTEVAAEQQFARQELHETVRSVLADLPHEMAVLLVDRYLEHLTTPELARQHNVTEQAVRSRLVRARDRFRELYEQRFGAYDDQSSSL